MLGDHAQSGAQIVGAIGAHIAARRYRRCPSCASQKRRSRLTSVDLPAPLGTGDRQAAAGRKAKTHIVERDAARRAHSETERRETRCCNRWAAAAAAPDPRPAGGASINSNRRRAAAWLVSSCCSAAPSGWTASKLAMAVSGSSARNTPSIWPPLTSGMARISTVTPARPASNAASALLNAAHGRQAQLGSLHSRAQTRARAPAALLLTERHQIGNALDLVRQRGMQARARRRCSCAAGP